MTIEQISHQYNIPLTVLREYEQWDLCADVKKVMGAWQYDDRDLERLSIIMTLRDIGFSGDEVKTYMELLLSGQPTEQQRMAMLNRVRSTTLNNIHFEEKKLERMDYLRHAIQEVERKSTT